MKILIFVDEVLKHLLILLVDYTRVKLSSVDDEPGSDYINANYIHVSSGLGIGCF